jgi:hypothetical protein
LSDEDQFLYGENERKKAYLYIGHDLFIDSIFGISYIVYEMELERRIVRLVDNNC